MPTVNERCKILRSLNRVYVLEIVLLLVPRLKILRRRGFLVFWDFRETKRHSQVPKEQTTTSGSQLGGGEDLRSIFEINLRRRNAVNLIWTPIYNGAALRRCSYAAFHQRQFVSK